MLPPLVEHNPGIAAAVCYPQSLIRYHKALVGRGWRTLNAPIALYRPFKASFGHKPGSTATVAYCIPGAAVAMRVHLSLEN